MHLQVETLDRQIGRILLDRILSGSLKPGANLNEVALAADLGVSRTPLRQALVRLDQEGFVYAESNRGFFVVPLTLAEARDLYPVLSALECLALRNAPPDTRQRKELHRLNVTLGSVDPEDTRAAVRANLAWHQALLSASGNQLLRRLLTNLRQQIYRYEISFFSPGEERLLKSVQLHESIVDALHEDDVELACLRLENHWVTDLEELAPK